MHIVEWVAAASEIVRVLREVELERIDSGIPNMMLGVTTAVVDMPTRWLA